MALVSLTLFFLPCFGILEVAKAVIFQMTVLAVTILVLDATQ